jgi:hypothetical protein
VKSHKIQVTINGLEQPNLTEYLQREPSARKRANIIKRLAELGAMLEKIGLADLTRGSLASPHLPTTQKGSLPERRLLAADLGDDFFANALSSFMSPSSEDSADDPSTGRSLHQK